MWGMRLSLLAFTIALLALPVCALVPQEVAVVYNNEPSVVDASSGVAFYYAHARGIPSANIVAISTVVSESATQSEYINQIATPISNYLSTHPNIKCIVLCYGIPSWMSVPTSNGRQGIDSTLELLGNDGALDANKLIVSHQNPYYNKNVDFDEFRNSSANTINVGSGQAWKLNYLVTRLDAFSQPTVNVNGVNIPRDVKAMIDRSTAATPGGNFVVDRSAFDVNSVIQRFTSDGISTENIITNSTSVFLTGQQDVIGYWGEHMIIDGNANNYTTWTRPLHHWQNGIVYAQLFVKRR